MMKVNFHTKVSKQHVRTKHVSVSYFASLQFLISIKCSTCVYVGVSNVKHPLGQEINPRPAMNAPARTPLSPVSAHSYRPNIKNTEVHAAINMPKSSLSAQPPLSRLSEEDEENTTPSKQTSSQQVSVPSTIPTTITSIYPQQAAVSMPQQMHRPPPQEYSFEEKRLAFMCHQQYHQSPVSACR